MGDSTTRSKTFISLDSLWYEEERLATFIDWPLKFISPQDLAANGFYYLRSKDHCACAFCRGIIGTWELGDTPEREHKRHFPSCPFVKGLPTPNVSISLGKILSKCSKGGKLKHPFSEDICGIKKDIDKPEPKTVLLPSGKALMSSELNSVGLHVYSGPKKKDFITYESRLESFRNWPSQILQKPQDLAEAGFYYCGVSDHVRCFHCGNGLRNWEADDIPWNEHVRWYPDCNFVLLTKGIDFIDKVRREKPPYLRACSSQSTAISPPSTSKAAIISLTEKEMENLLDLPVMKYVVEMGFDKQKIKTALYNKLQQTGVPFFTTESCIEAVLQVEDTSEDQASNRENIDMQERKLEGIQATTPLISSSSNSTLSHPESSPSGPLVGVDETQSRPNITSISSILPPLPSLLDVTPPLRASTPTSQVEQNLAHIVSSQEPQSSEGDTLQILSHSQEAGEDEVTMRRPNEGINRQVSVSASPSQPFSPSPSYSSSSSASTSASTPPSLTLHSSLLNFRLPLSTVNGELANNDLDPLLEAEHVIEEADKILKNKQTTSESGDETTPKKEESLVKADLDMEEESLKGEEETALCNEADKLAEELEKLRECRMCRVCMDKEMDIVFLPCTHMVTCSSCAVALTACPICRRGIQYAFKPIIS